MRNTRIGKKWKWQPLYKKMVNAQIDIQRREESEWARRREEAVTAEIKKAVSEKIYREK